MGKWVGNPRYEVISMRVTEGEKAATKKMALNLSVSESDILRAAAEKGGLFTSIKET